MQPFVYYISYVFELLSLINSIIRIPLSHYFLSVLLTGPVTGGRLYFFLFVQLLLLHITDKHFI